MDEQPNDDKKEVPLQDLPWYLTLRTILEPYVFAKDELDCDECFSTAELIQQIEIHHVIPQSVVGKHIHGLVDAEDFVRAMTYLGFRAFNIGAGQLQWLVKYA